MPALRLRGLSKDFPGQRALDAVDLDLVAGRVHGLVGQNGSGKSTLIKILAGFHDPEPGAEAWVGEEPFQLGSAAEAERCGLRFVHQDLALVPTLDAVDNLALGRGYESGRWIPLKREAQRAREILAQVGLEIDVNVPVGRLTPVERTMIAIARALHDDEDVPARLLVLDEPTEPMSKSEVGRLFEAIRTAASRGTAILYVSHRLDEVLDISDEIGVLRDGRIVASRQAAELDHEALVELLVGHALERLESVADTQARAQHEATLRVRGLSGRLVSEMSFHVDAGEILGFAGLAGSGREEVPYLLSGAVAREGGELELSNRVVACASPREAIEEGIFLVAADREEQSAIQTLTLRENVTLPRVDTVSFARWLSVRRERVEATGWLDRTGVTPPDPDRDLLTLSGGNQQKVVLAKALRCRPSVLLLDEPVQGIDVAARVAVFQQLLDLASEGVAVAFSSTEPEDLAAVCGRVLVLREGRVVAELSGESLTVDRIIEQSLVGTTSEVS